MADQITVQCGSLPWQPSPDSLVLEIYNEHDVPTAGIVRQLGVDYLFQCVSEERGGITVWTYALVSRTERLSIEEATPEEFEARMDAVLQDRGGVLAIALEGFGVRFSTPVEDWARDGKRELHGLFELLDNLLEILREDAKRQLVELGSLFPFEALTSSGD